MDTDTTFQGMTHEDGANGIEEAISSALTEPELSKAKAKAKEEGWDALAHFVESPDSLVPYFDTFTPDMVEGGVISYLSWATQSKAQWIGSL